ncbi:DUF4396 domain-containing protein [Planomonospora sp. ID91781]|uniref:Membrane protein n=1 Tax=Planomonospora sphaerica TaxID=161355 RepID=A0A161MB36_9ACTN|nr:MULTISPECIES: DUF4396 domain-containing protein [Planomonospora]MBG0823385.1 DUF4396 domain-containing protein [Planomonospora sp. ID91781]GAT67083.1 membrane protein [Planomonospora sphaerica]
MSEPTHHTAHGQQRTGGAHPGHHGHDHRSHAAHEGHAGHASKTTWKTAASATLHCLTGCAIGEVLGLVIGTALGWATAPTIVLAVALAFFFGYLLTLIPLRRAGVNWGTAIKLALAADTVSIVVMEIVDNGVMLIVPGAMDAGLTTGLFWGALALAFLVAFLVTTPVNKWIIGRGKGHAVVHAYHH